MYLRFVAQAIDEDSLVRRGVLITAGTLRDDSATAQADREALGTLLSWFDSNLKRPARFSRTKSKGHYRRRAAGISWFKDTAYTHIEKMRALSEVLARYGHSVTMLKESRPGYLIYEDEFQIVAEPFADAAR